MILVFHFKLIVDDFSKFCFSFHFGSISFLIVDFNSASRCARWT